jgi:hypothetical protein
MKKYFLILASLFTSLYTFGQISNLTIQEIDSIVNRIDTTCIRSGITDFTVKSKNKKTRKIISGGGADWYYTDNTGKLVKVIREISLDTENFDTYYFHQDTLIYLKTTNLSYKDDERIINWNRQCYFQNKKLVLNQDNLLIAFNPKNYIETAKGFFDGHPIWKK